MSVVYGTTANVAGVAIRNFRIGPSLSNRIGTSDSNSNIRRSLITIMRTISAIAKLLVLVPGIIFGVLNIKFHARILACITHTG